MESIKVRRWCGNSTHAKCKISQDGWSMFKDYKRQHSEDIGYIKLKIEKKKTSKQSIWIELNVSFWREQGDQLYPKLEKIQFEKMKKLKNLEVTK